MKKLIIFIGALSAITVNALERKFEKGYEYTSLSVNTEYAEGGVSLFKQGAAFARKDSSYTLTMPDSVGKQASELQADSKLTSMHYDGQFAYDEKLDLIYISHDSLLYSVVAKNGKAEQLEIQGLGDSRQQFASGSSLAYRRWRYKIPGVKGLFNPALSKDGNKLYFSAVLEGGKGGRDLWMVTKKENGTWSAPQNLEILNSAFDDDFPFLTGDSLLYFSSNRPDALPGWNVYRSNLHGDPRVTLLPEGVNSSANDYNFAGNELTVFVVSDRGGNPDIYSPSKLPVIETKVPVDTVPVDTVPTQPEKQDTIIEQQWEKEPCIFHFVFNKDVFIKNYDEQIKEYAQIIKANPNRKFAINGHTDIRGNVEYNLSLSERRCMKVYNRLLKEGVNPDQLEFFGYGKSILYIESAKNEAEHLLNRRVEIKVVK